MPAQYGSGGKTRLGRITKAGDRYLRTLLILGARSVLVGRPVVWGLGAAGADGVTDVLLGLRDELATAMGLSGIVDVHDVPRDLVA